MVSYASSVSVFALYLPCEFHDDYDLSLNLFTLPSVLFLVVYYI